MSNGWNVRPGDFLERFVTREMILAVAGVNLAGSLFGFYYYMPQLAETSPALWIFVADSPLATLSIAVALLLRLRGSSSELLEGFAFVANLKYGLWTAFVLIYYFEAFNAANTAPMYFFLLFSHLAMAVQVLLVSRRFTIQTLAALSAWFLANDTLDYFLDIHSRLFTEHGHPFSAAMVAAYSLSAVSLLLASRVSAGTPPTSSPGSTSLFTSE